MPGCWRFILSAPVTIKNYILQHLSNFFGGFAIKPSKHDSYVQLLKARLEDDYDLILTNVPLYHKKRQRYCLTGEIDLLGKKGDQYHAYEVKCSYRITKARLQLLKIIKNARYKYNIANSYFYCGDSKSLVEIRK